jgi:hypothetical protein
MLCLQVSTENQVLKQFNAVTHAISPRIAKPIFMLQIEIQLIITYYFAGELTAMILPTACLSALSGCSLHSVSTSCIKPHKYILARFTAGRSPKIILYCKNTGHQGRSKINFCTKFKFKNRDLIGKVSSSNAKLAVQDSYIAIMLRVPFFCSGYDKR